MSLPDKTTTHVQSINLSRSPLPFQSGHLRLGGVNPEGQTIAFDSYTMLRNDQPVIPVMGEFHFSRYPAQYWEEALLKIKAGGIDIVATYVFWIHVEEDEGSFDWLGNRDLRRFVQLCGKHGLEVLVRIGPFAHGECRNGGLPDWLYGRPFEVRSNDERYLAYVQRLYGEIARQVEGLLFKDGGPVIGVQLDNEYMHCGAPWEVTFKQGTEWVPAGSDGAAHILKLKALAIAAGFDVPIYSCTGWLRSPIPEGEVLPMQGGYAFTPWSPDPNYRQPPTREFLFRNRHLNPVLNGEPTYDASKYPLACCEIGGGIQDTYYHRPIVPPESVEALSLVNLAGGANLIGYYMYHGGSNPVGKHSYLNEFTVPRISYDFQAPLREYGQATDSYRSLRLLHLFLRDFGEVLAPMQVTLPENAANITPEDTDTLRYAVRSKDGAGFIFLNNYQDHVEMQDIVDIQFEFATPQGTITVPQTHGFTLQKDVSAILPFGLSLDGIELQYATAQLLCHLEDEAAAYYVFFAPRGISSEYAFVPQSVQMLSADNGIVSEANGLTLVNVSPGWESLFTLTNAQGKAVRFLTLRREQAEQSCKLSIGGKEHLVISNATIVQDGQQLILLSTGHHQVDLTVFPPIGGKLTPDSGITHQENGEWFTQCSFEFATKNIHVAVEQIDDLRAAVHIPPDLLEGVHNVFLRLEYVGDIGNCFINGKLVADNFNNGSIWEIGLKHLLQPGKETDLFFLITPVRRQAGIVTYVPTGMAFHVEDDVQSVGGIQSIDFVPEYKFVLRYSEET